jgi:hypothetical protein
MKVISSKAEAASEQTSPERLAMLGESTDVGVRRALARNQHTPSTTLELLSHSSDKATRKNVVLNPNTPTNVLLKLAPQFPRFFFKNPAFDWLLLEDPDLLINLGQGVLKNILKTSECPESFMRWAVGFGGEEEKLAVAMNANAPVQCLQELTKCYGMVRSAALGHSKLFLASDTLSMEDVFLTALKVQLHGLSCMDAETLLERNFIDLPQLPFLNSAVRVDLSESHANPQISVECYLNEVDSPDPSELMSFLWWCYSKYEFESFPPKLEEIKAVGPEYFQTEHVQLLIEVVERRLDSFFRLPDDAFVLRETNALVFLFSCMPPEAAFPDRVYRLLSKCCLRSESARSDLLEVCRTAVGHKQCPSWFREDYPHTQTTGDLYKRALPSIQIETAISCLHSLKTSWLTNNKKDFELNKSFFREAIGNSAHLRLSNFKSDDVERIFMATFDLYALLDQQIAGWDEQETSELRRWVTDIVWHVFQNAACPREMLVEITQQKDKRFAGLIGLAESVLDVRLIIFEPKSSDWFLKRQRRTRDLTVAPAVDGGNVLFIRASKAQKACNSKSLIARVLGLSHRLAEPKVLAKRCKSLYWIERLAIARNPNTPLNILDVLNRDANVLVSRQAELSKNRFRNPDPKALTRDSTDVSTLVQPVVQVGFIGRELELASPCPNCGGRIVFFEPDETEKAGFTCKGTAQTEEGCGFAVRKIIAKRVFSPDEVNSLVRDKRLGPLDGFRSKAGWPFVATIVIKLDDETKNHKLDFDFGDDKAGEESGEIIDFSGKESLGSCPKCGGAVFEHGKNYVCEKSVSTLAQTVPDCDFKCSQIILRQPIFHDQLRKLLETGKSDVLDKFVSIRSGKSFKAMLTWDAEAGKINFEFLPQSFHPALSIPKKRRLRPPMQFLRNTQLT